LKAFLTAIYHHWPDQPTGTFDPAVLVSSGPTSPNSNSTSYVDNKIKERLDKLAESRDDVLAQELDQAITNGMLLAGAKCETAKRLPKSGKLHEAQTVMIIYQNVLSQLRTKRDLSQQIEK
jgi:hypothetical protein